MIAFSVEGDLLPTGKNMKNTEADTICHMQEGTSDLGFAVHVDIIIPKEMGPLFGVLKTMKISCNAKYLAILSIH